MIALEENAERRFTSIDYIDSIEDPFFKTQAQQVIGNRSDGGQEEDDDAPVKDRLEDLEIALRKKLLGLLLSLQERGNESADGKSAADMIGTFWKSSLDLCHHFVHHACSSASPDSETYKNLMPSRRLPYLLLSDCLEGLPTLEDAKAFWNDYVEPELVDTVLFGDQFWSQLTESNNSKKFSLPSSHLPFLKVANQFLKRLEHSSDNMVRVEWKGRIMWALSKGFSITDKSSMKLWGNFHTTNETDFESQEDFNKQITPGVSPSMNSIEYNLYEAFWSLQNDFSNPNKINVAEFIKRLRLILATMESATATSDSTVIADQSEGIDKPTTKYLTSSALLPSQIQDPTFRSSVVTQFLIVASHLGAESPPLKNALASLLGRARKLLKNDNPQLHDILWDSILASGREDQWRTWKKQKCAASAFAPTNKRNQQLVLDSIAVKDDDRGQKRKLAATEEENGSSKESIVSSLSTNDLNKNELVAVSRDSYYKIPTLDEHLELYVEALDPESGIEDEYHPKNDSLFTWRAMRLYAKNQLPLMSQCRKPAHLERITRTWYKESHGTDIPGEMLSDDATDPVDDQAGNEQKDTSKRDETSMDIEVKDEKESTSIDANTKDSELLDTEMKDDEDKEEAQKQEEQKSDDKDIASSKEVVEDTVESGVKDAKKGDGDEQKPGKSEANKKEGEDIESANVKNEVSPPTRESRKGTESSCDGKTTKTKTENVNEETPKDKRNEGSKSNTAAGKEMVKEDKNSERVQNNRNDNQRQDNRLPRDNPPPQNRGGGRRGNEAGRNMQDRGRRDDGPPPRRRGDDNHQSRGGGRSGGDSSYRGRSDAPPSRGGRYDEDYRGDSSRHHSDYRGDRFNGDRSGRSTGRDNHRGGERGGGIGRDDHRGSGGRPRAGGGGGRRRR